MEGVGQGGGWGGFFILCICKYSGTPSIRSPMGQKTLAVLRGDRTIEGFSTRKCMVVFAGCPKKVAIITM